MKITFKTLLRIPFSALFLFPLIAFGQDGSDIEMADTFRGDGKIYVVIAVIAVILFGLIIYLISIDRKLSRLEKKVKEKN